jgi:RNA polymerase sigma factor (sigma-70 family)
LLRVYGSLRRRGGAPEDWYAYLRRAVINEYVRTRRLRSNSEIVNSEIVNSEKVTATVPDRAASQLLEDRVADRELLWAALEMLSPRQRAVLVLRYYEGLTDEEIAAVLGCRGGSVRSLASRGLATLRQLVKPLDTDQEAWT